MMSAKGNGYPVILGRPWLMSTKAIQDWDHRHLILKKGDQPKVVYDMKERKHEEMCYEDSSDELQAKEYLSTSEEETESESEVTMEEESSREVMGIWFPQMEQPHTNGVQPMIEELNPREGHDETINKMLSKTFSSVEKKEYRKMLRQFPRLFVTNYSEIRGVDAIQHHIEIK